MFRLDVQLVPGNRYNRHMLSELVQCTLDILTILVLDILIVVF